MYLFLFHFQGKAGKYTQYSNQTGVTKDNQSTESECPQSAVSVTEFLEALPGLAEEILQFATERNWTQYHTARNLVLALLGEVGELAELFQWKGDDKDATNDLSSEELDKMSQELADVSIYLLRLATVCEVVPQLGAGLEELYL
jgi:NTP pyrophosphatase (non-canonical NTP hydrolase)